MQVPKLIRDNKVAVLISRGFSAGWSTWADSREKKEILLFHRDIVEAVLSGDLVKAANIASDIISENCKDDYFYKGGFDGLDVEWVHECNQFEVNEYDGRESLHIIGNRNYFSA